MVKELIKLIIKELEEENKSREYDNERLIDIPFNIVTLEQYLEDDTYKEFHRDLERYNFDVQFIENNDEDGYPKERYIKVYLYEKGNEESYYCDNLANFSYKITLDDNPRYWGGCECEEGDIDYDARYKCCGHGCDWEAPAFSVHKIIDIGNNAFKGDEHDFWDYRDKYNNVTVKDKKEQERLAKIRGLKEQQEYIAEQLAQLEK